MTTIFHITTVDTWRKAQAQGTYTFCSLASEGFIHCSTKSQFLGVANRIFRNKTDLKLLQIDQAKLIAEVRYENLEGGTEMFPHIYGPMNLDAVEGVHTLTIGPNGTFELPSDL